MQKYRTKAPFRKQHARNGPAPLTIYSIPASPGVFCVTPSLAFRIWRERLCGYVFRGRVLDAAFLLESNLQVLRLPFLEPLKPSASHVHPFMPFGYIIVMAMNQRSV